MHSSLIFNLHPHLLKSIVHVIRFITNRKYTFYGIYQVRLSPVDISLIYCIKIDHVLLQIIMIDSCGIVHCSNCFTVYSSISHRTAYRQVTKYRNRKTYVCCDGYKSTPGLSYCVRELSPVLAILFLWVIPLLVSLCP